MRFPSSKKWLVALGFFALSIAVVFIYVKSTRELPNAGQSTFDADEIASWDGRAMLMCNGTQKVTLADVTATAGIQASGHCRVSLSNVVITAPTALAAMGHAEIDLKGGALNGTPTAIAAMGNAKVTLAGTTVVGEQSKAGNATIAGR